MKKAILLLSMLCMCAAIQAQSSRKGFWVRPLVGIGGGYLDGNNMDFYGYPLSSKFTIYFSGGVDLGGMFTDRVGLFGGIAVSGYGYRNEYSEYAGSISATGANVYLEVPLYFRFITSQYRKLGYFMDFGFKNGFLVGAKTTAEITDHSSGLTETETIDGNDDHIYNSYSASPFMFLGFNIPAGAIVDINVGPEISYQATNLFDDAENSYGKQMKGHYFNFGVKLAVGIRCSK